jgi:hypothetical protein
VFCPSFSVFLPSRFRASFAVISVLIAPALSPSYALKKN